MRTVFMAFSPSLCCCLIIIISMWGKKTAKKNRIKYFSTFFFFSFSSSGISSFFLRYLKFKWPQRWITKEPRRMNYERPEKPNFFFGKRRERRRETFPLFPLNHKFIIHSGMKRWEKRKENETAPITAIHFNPFLIFKISIWIFIFQKWFFGKLFRSIK